MPVRVRPRQINAHRSHRGKWLSLLFLLGLVATASLYWPLIQRLGSELHT
ncbi:iron dicitrate transport regulator FecR, partial [Enterobacter mori]